MQEKTNKADLIKKLKELVKQLEKSFNEQNKENDAEKKL